MRGGGEDRTGIIIFVKPSSTFTDDDVVAFMCSTTNLFFVFHFYHQAPLCLLSLAALFFLKLSGVRETQRCIFAAAAPTLHSDALFIAFRKTDGRK